MLNHVALFLGAVATSVDLITTVAMPTPSSEPGSCFGQAPTIVGYPGAQIEGTADADVVITNGALIISTLRGDDLVCVTGPAGKDRSIKTGQGDDRIDTSAVPAGSIVRIDPGPGADEVIGGSAAEEIRSLDPSRGDLDRDVISTAGGRDRIMTGGYAGSSNEDVIDLGTEADLLTVIALWPRAAIRGGRGRDVLQIKMPEIASWKLDNRRERLMREGTLSGQWSSFSVFEYPGLRGPVTFVGSHMGETLQVGIRRRWPMKLFMAGGDDTLFASVSGSGSFFDGGKGTDTIGTIFGEPHPDGDWTYGVFLDLLTGEFRKVHRDRVSTNTALHFENAEVGGWSGPATINGTGAPNLLSGWATRVTLHGRAGDDVLVGAYGDDILIGGGGDDVAQGRHGTDRCDTEVRRNCER